MYYPKNYNLEVFHFIYDQPAHANRLAVDLGFSWNFPALSESEGIFLNTIYCLKDLITDTNGS